jgi:hypothetical protein
MRLFVLYMTSILAGFCMMALEILGGRLLQPVFGTSIDVWAAIITTFILSLSIGYVIGGRIADRARTNAPLGWVILAAGVCYLVTPLFAFPFMDALPDSLTQARWGVLVAALVLFLVPLLLLGAVSPMLVKLAFVDAQRVGRTTGTLYAIGSFGNVLGILVSNYVLLQYADLNHTIWAMGLVLGLLGAAHVCLRMQTETNAPAAVAPVVAGAGA